MTNGDATREALNRLKLRLAAGDIGRAEYRQLCTEIGAEENGDTPGPSGVSTETKSMVDLALVPGRLLFDRWRILSELGRGEIGAVFAVRESDGQTQAIKVFDPAIVRDHDLLRDLRDRVNRVRELVHPRIVRLFGYQEDRTQLLAMTVMEQVDGCTVLDLGALARSRGQAVPVELGVAIFSQTLDALAAAHAEGIVHGALSPNNVLLAGGTAAQLLSGQRRDPKVKLADLGVASMAKQLRLSPERQRLGLTAYLAPEHLLSGTEISSKGDLYSAGAVAYELLTGKTPMVTGYESADLLRPQLAPRAAASIMRAINRDPADRPTAEAGLASLSGAPEVGSRGMAKPEAGEKLLFEPAAEPVPASGRRWPLFAIAATALIAVGALLVNGLGGGDPPGPPPTATATSPAVLTQTPSHTATATATATATETPARASNAPSATPTAGPPTATATPPATPTAAPPTATATATIAATATATAIAVPKMARLIVRSPQPGAEVLLNSQFRGMAPVDLRLKAGSYRLRLHKVGCTGAEEFVALTAGEILVLDLKITCPTPGGPKR